MDMEIKKAFDLTDDEKRMVRAVFAILLKKPYSELNCFLGSETIRNMQRLHHKLKYERYCVKNGIRLEDLDEADYISAYEEECQCFDNDEE